MAKEVAIITGGATGIGAAVVRRLAAKGVCCVINYAHSKDAAEALADEVGSDAIAVKADVTDDDAATQLASVAVQRFGRIDYLINNAGKTKHMAHEDLDGLSAEDFIDIYRLNTVAAFQVTRSCVPAMREGPASAVVNVASVAGVFGNGSSIAYAASKGALATMTKSLARVLAPEIRVNAVAPGYVGTGWFEKLMGADGLRKMNDRIAATVPMGFAADADAIAGPIVDMLDPAWKTMTGEVVLLDAGAHLDVGLSRRPGKKL